MPSHAISEAGRVLSQASKEKLSPAQRKAISDKALTAFHKRFEDLVDPDRTLPVDERARRVAKARSEYFRCIGRVGLASRWKTP